MRLTIAAGLMATGLAWATDVPVDGAAVVLMKGTLCTAVSDREPVGSHDSRSTFELVVERVYFWNLLQAAQPPQSVKHVWYRDGKAVGEIELSLKHARTRTWSSKQIRPGDWKVESVAPDGQVLQTAEFTVR